MRRIIGFVFLALGMAFVFAAGLFTGTFVLDERFADVQAMSVNSATKGYLSSVQGFYSGQDVPADYELDPTRDMPGVVIDGLTVIGNVRVDSVGIDVSVAESWETEAAGRVPCRYSGSAYTKDMVVAGHNYRSHFGSLSGVEVDDGVVFTDMDGNEFYYRVTGIETIHGADVKGLEAGDWDLTLFTCTLGGRDRVVVRCSEMTEE